MPTPTGLPKVGEIWEHRYKLPPDWQENVVRFKVLSRGRGDYWSMHVEILSPRSRYVWLNKALWVDCAYWLSQGELHYVEDE